MLLGRFALFLDLFERLGSPPRLLNLHHLELFFAMIETIGTMVFLLNSFKALSLVVLVEVEEFIRFKHARAATLLFLD